MVWENEDRQQQPETPQPIFIGGCPRSGTTLLGAMLGTHPACLATPESKFNTDAYRLVMQRDGRVELPAAMEIIRNHWNFRLWDIAQDAEELALARSHSYGELVKRLVQAYGAQRGKPLPAYWVDHTPLNILHVPLLFQLYPDARLIHIVRDGRGVAASVMKLDWGPNTVDAAAPWWITRVAHGLAAELHFGSDRVLRISYEALVQEPEATVRQVCDFVGVRWQPEMLHGTGFQVPEYSMRQHGLVGTAPQSGRATAWQKELSPRQIEIFESLAGNILSCLGYELHYGARARTLTRVEQAALKAKTFLMTKVVNTYRIQARIRQAVALTANSRQVERL